MKAIVARAFAPIDQLEYAEWPDPQAGGREVVIQAEAIGVNFPDGLLVQGLYQMKPALPFVPGMEVAGPVIAVGPEATRLRVGDRVAAFVPMGAYAEKVAVDEGAALAIPKDMSAEDGAALICGHGTAQHALRQRGDLKPGETLCVLGAAGATGLAAVQIGKAMGARVIAVASSAEKRAVALEAGADIVLGYDDLKNTLKAATGGRGIDVAFDPVGGDSFDALARSMAWKGRLLVIGFTAGRIPQFPVNLALVKGFSVVGVFWGAFIEKEPDVHAANMRELFAWYETGKIKPRIEGIYPLKDAAAVLGRLHQRAGIGKIVLAP